QLTRAVWQARERNYKELAYERREGYGGRDRVAHAEEREDGHDGQRVALLINCVARVRGLFVQTLKMRKVLHVGKRHGPVLGDGDGKKRKGDADANRPLFCTVAEDASGIVNICKGRNGQAEQGKE